MRCATLASQSKGIAMPRRDHKNIAGDRRPARCGSTKVATDIAHMTAHSSIVARVCAQRVPRPCNTKIKPKLVNLFTCARASEERNSVTILLASGGAARRAHGALLRPGAKIPSKACGDLAAAGAGCFGAVPFAPSPLCFFSAHVCRLHVSPLPCSPSTVSTIGVSRPGVPCSASPWPSPPVQ